jgi:hypothetical protein
MTFMIEVYYAPPTCSVREQALTQLAALCGGQLDFREDATPHTGVCLTFEFGSLADAEQAAAALRLQGEHVEGPARYT